MTYREQRRRVYAPIERKTFASAVRTFILDEFPHLGGPMIVDLFVEKLNTLVDEFCPPTNRLRMGQLLWFAVAKDEKPSYGKSMDRTRIVPVVLTVVSSEDIERFKDGVHLKEIRKGVEARLYREAYEQGGVLSEADLSVILRVNLDTISVDTVAYERENGCVLPRRGTVHDMGRSVSHKSVICKKRRLHGRSTSEVARETGHTNKSVDRYTLALDRIQFCTKMGLSVEAASFVTGLSKNLVIEYTDLAQEIEAIKSQEMIEDDVPF